MAPSHARAGRPPDASQRLSVQVRLWGLRVASTLLHLCSALIRGAGVAVSCGRASSRATLPVEEESPCFI